MLRMSPAEEVPRLRVFNLHPVSARWIWRPRVDCVQTTCAAYLAGAPADDARFLAIFAHSLEHAGGYSPQEAKRVALLGPPGRADVEDRARHQRKDRRAARP